MLTIFDQYYSIGPKILVRFHNLKNLGQKILVLFKIRKNIGPKNTGPVLKIGPILALKNIGKKTTYASQPVWRLRRQK